MIRASAKNHRFVTSLSDPEDYPGFLEELEQQDGKTTLAFRKGHAAKAFQRTSHYDSMVAGAWSETSSLPISLKLSPQTPLRYGENPHQAAAWSGKPTWKVLQ